MCEACKKDIGRSAYCGHSMSGNYGSVFEHRGDRLHFCRPCTARLFVSGQAEEATLVYLSPDLLPMYTEPIEHVGIELPLYPN